MDESVQTRRGSRVGWQVLKPRLASVVTAKSRPGTLFEQVFYDIREKAKAFKKEQSSKAQGWLTQALYSDLQSRGLQVELKVSLGQYRGSKFVTSAKLAVKGLQNEKTAQELLVYLKGKYSPKYKLKKFEGGIARYNVR